MLVSSPGLESPAAAKLGPRRARRAAARPHHARSALAPRRAARGHRVFESLEPRINFSWFGVPPLNVTPVAPAAVALDAQGDAAGTAAISSTEVDYYAFTANASGAYRITATTPTSNVDTVIGVFSSAGRRLAYNDDTFTSTDSSLTVTLSAGQRYYLAVTSYVGSPTGSYRWSIDGPATGTTVPPTDPPTPTTSGFQIDVVTTGMSAAVASVFQAAAARWSQIIVGDVPDATYNGVRVDDVRIDASAISIDGAGGILGQAGPDRFRSGSSLPYHGVMQFDSADLAQLQSQGTLLAVIEHEMGHVLGIGTIWSNRGLLVGAGTSNPLFVGAQATAAYNQIFGTQASGVPVENSGGSGTRDSHWRESILKSELMTGYLGPGTHIPISRITVGSLADMGYTVNYAAADSFTASGAIVASALGSSSIASAASLSSARAADDATAGAVAAAWHAQATDHALAEMGFADFAPHEQHHARGLRRAASWA